MLCLECPLLASPHMLCAVLQRPPLRPAPHAVCQDAGCINLALALALLLGDQAALQDFSDEQPAVWAELHSLLANDVHLCTYSAVLSPLPSPMVQPPMLMATP